MQDTQEQISKFAMLRCPRSHVMCSYVTANAQMQPEGATLRFRVADGSSHAPPRGPERPTVLFTVTLSLQVAGSFKVSVSLALGVAHEHKQRAALHLRIADTLSDVPLSKPK